MNILSELRSRFAAALNSLTHDPESFADMVRPAQDPKFGDYQANCAMPLAKQVGKPPRDVAAEIVENLYVSDLCETPEIAGPGFINLKLREDWLTGRLNGIVSDDRLGVSAAQDAKTIVIDYSSPNVAKPMHVGHLRSTVIGDALYRVLTFLGHSVISDNHIGDWGTQFGMIIYGYRNFLDEAAYADDPVGELARLYRLVNQLSEYHDAKSGLPQLKQRLSEQQQRLTDAEAEAGDDKKKKKALKKLRTDIANTQETLSAAAHRIDSVDQDADLRELAAQHTDVARSARDETARLHAGDADNQRLWDELLPHCVAALNEVYDRLGVRFDHTLGESFYQPQLSGVVDSLSGAQHAVESDGAMCVFIEGNDAPFIVRKADGAYTYATTDLATIKHRIDAWHADTMLYVVDARQSEHFKLLFATARKWLDEPVELSHVSFGTVMGDDGKPIKTRTGEPIVLESLIDEAIARARAIVDENDEAKRDADDNPAPELDDETRQAVAEIVGIGGIKYADLRHNRESDYVFSWDKMLAKNGDTATYMQYAYARICGIFRKGNVNREELRSSGGRIALTHAAERALAIQICRFPDALAAVTTEYRPNLLTQYLFETANQLSTFYDQCQVLHSEVDAETRTSRLLLVDLAGRVIAQGLALLGIEVCERM